MSGDFDLDRLADYFAGLLDAADAATVSRLVETAARWASAYAALAAADTSVRDDLREAARSRLDPMPADVIARIEEALAGERAPATTTTGRRRRSNVPHAGLRRRFTIGLTTAAAAVIVIAGALGVVAQLIEPGTDEQAAARDHGATEDAGAPQPAIAPPAGEDAATGGPAFVNSGTDYGPATLARLALSATVMGEAPPQVSAPSLGPSFDAGEGTKVPAVPLALRESVAGPLGRLTDPTALAACLAAVARSHPGTPAVVDYARYEGSPALLVLVRTVTSAAVVVVGPDCGLADVDEVAFATIS